MDSLIDFIVATHTCEKLKVKREEVNGMLKEGPKYQNPNPHVIAHFDAINYLLPLAAKETFPVKDSRTLTSQYKSDDALDWFRKLHEKMSFTLSHKQHPEWADECANVKQYECGVYRACSATLAFNYAPHYEEIPKILHVWLKELAEINDAVYPHLDNPRGITKAQHERMEAFAYQSCLLCSNLLPFNYGNNRFGRLLENLLRLHWNFEWKPVPSDYKTYIKDIQEFFEDELPKYQAKIKELR
jgi:hypothetical protein